MHIFKGEISSGIGKHTELYVPGYNQLVKAPENWPEKLHPGSLNVRISSTGYPSIFSEREGAPSIFTLDEGIIPCAFEIPYDSFGNNALRPTAQMPKRGTAQVWRSTLAIVEQEIDCWVLRRYGSMVGEVLEVVSHVHLRTAYELQDGQRVQLRFVH